MTTQWYQESYRSETGCEVAARATGAARHAQTPAPLLIGPPHNRARQIIPTGDKAREGNRPANQLQEIIVQCGGCRFASTFIDAVGRATSVKFVPWNVRDEREETSSGTPSPTLHKPSLPCRILFRGAANEILITRPRLTICLVVRSVKRWNDRGVRIPQQP